MNNHFSSIIKILAEKISTVSNPLLSDSFVINNSNAKFQFKAIQVQEFRDVLAKVITAKDFRDDDILSFFLNLALPFALLFNTSIETSHLQSPGKWKGLFFSQQMETWLMGSKYRLISVLPVIARLFEKLVENQFYQLMEIEDCCHLCNLPTGVFILLSPTH